MTRYATPAEFREYWDQLPAYGVQTVTITGSPSGGTFTLSYDGQTTAAIAYNATAAAVASALRALSNLVNSVREVRGPAGGPWEVIFSGTGGHSPLTATSSLTGGTSPAIAVANTTEARIGRVLDRASAIIDIELGYSFGTAAPGTQVVYGDGTDFLVPPLFTPGSVTLVSTLSGYTVPDYVERDGMLVVARSDRIYRDYGVGWDECEPDILINGSTGQGWVRGLPYTVAATFGVADVPADIEECCLEIAVRIWKGKDAGFSDVVGVDGAGAVGYNGAFSNLVKEILQKRQSARSIGVW